MLRNLAYGTLLTDLIFPLLHTGVWTVTHLTSEAIQEAVDAADEAGGGIVFCPPGVYVLTAPIRLPRTWYNNAPYYLNHQGSVYLMGAGKMLTHLRANPGVMSCVTWKGGASLRTRAMDQRISGMTLRAAATAGAKCIHYDYENFDTSGEVTHEIWSGIIEELVCEVTNQYHEYAIDLEGNVHQGTFRRIWGAASVGADTYTTTLLRFAQGSDAALDVGGAYDSRIESCYLGVNGGQCALVQGRMVGGSIRDSIQGIVVTHAPAIDLYNAAGVTIEGFQSEGHSGVPTIRLTDCRRVSLRGAALGYMVPPYTAIETVNLVGSEGCKIEDIGYWPAPVPGLSSFGVAYRRVRLDASSHNNLVDIDIGQGDNLANTVSNSGNNNRIRVYNAQTGLVETSP